MKPVSIALLLAAFSSSTMALSLVNPPISPPLFPEGAPADVVNTLKRLNYTGFNTKVIFKSFFKNEYLALDVKYDYWDQNSNRLKSYKQTWTVHKDGKPTEYNIPAFATNLRMTINNDVMYVKLPLVSNPTICTYNNPFYTIDKNTKKAYNILEMGFYKTKDNKVAWKVGIPTESGSVNNFGVAQYVDCDITNRPNTPPPTEPGYDEQPWNLD